MRYWLFKSEPSSYGIDDLARDRVTAWSGVRNYQARNFMRDEMRTGDRALFYHSSCDEPGIAGIVEVCKPAYSDETQFDRTSRYYDAGATRDEPRWFNVDVKFVEKTRVVGPAELRGKKALRKMQVLQRGNRLSVTPVTAAEWGAVTRMLSRSQVIAQSDHDSRIHARISGSTSTVSVPSAKTERTRQIMITNLVIGSDGFVGMPLCRYLEDRGERALHFDIKRGTHEDARVVQMDLGTIDRVYFLAWEVGGAKYLYRGDIQFAQLDSNLRLMLNVFPQLQKARTPFLFVSSQLAEESDTVYGITKRLGEVWTRLLGGVRVRLWNVYGAYERSSERSHVVADFVWQALHSGEIRILTTGEELRQFVFIDDACRAFHEALQQRLGGVYDVTSFEWVPVRRVADVIAELTGVKVVPGERRGSTPITPMCGKVPNWTSRVALEDGLARTVALYREYDRHAAGQGISRV